MSRSERRAERIRSEVPIERVLALYGYEVRTEGGSREQQFRCDLHGDGTDNKPSARCYPSSNTWYCWACNQSRDAIQTVREKEGASFHGAIESLEKNFGLPPLPWEDGDGGDAHIDPLQGVFDPYTRTFEDDSRRCNALLESMCQERVLPLRLVLALLEEYDRICVQAMSEPDDAWSEMTNLCRRVLDAARNQ